MSDQIKLPKPKIETACVQDDEFDFEDKLRFLVTRFRGRGLPKDFYDYWMPNLAPSEKLLRRFQKRDKNSQAWREFSRAYKAELFEPAPIDNRNQTIKNHGQKFTLRLIKEIARENPIVLLCHCGPDEEYCHRHLLKEVLESSKV